MKDLVVLEVAGSIAGAYTAKLLGDRGACVGMLEPAEGAPLRADPAAWAAWCTSRTALRLGSDAARDWARRADIVIESSAEGPLRELPADIASDVAETAVRVRISPFGSFGPYASWRSADIVDQAIGGHLYLSGDPSREPLQGPSGQAALAAGVYGAIGAMAALHSRRSAGPEAAGQTVEVSHHETMVALHQYTDVCFTHAGNVLKRRGNRYAGPGGAVGMYRAKDGWVALAVITAEHGEILLGVTGLDELLERPGVGNIAELLLRRDVLDPALNDWMAHRTVEEAAHLLQSVRLAAAPVLTMTQLLNEPHLADRGWWALSDVGGTPVRIAGPPFRVDTLPWSATPAPGPAITTCPGALPAKSSQPVSIDLTRRFPLEGLRVLDLTRAWAGPLAARILGELGADVVMVEAPWSRTPLHVPKAHAAFTHFFPDDEPSPHPWNRHGAINKFSIAKRSVGLDISQPAGKEVLQRLVAGADLLIENYSPRVMPNLGFTEERLREINPELVYVTMPGYGRTGPAKDYSAYGLVLDSHAGLSSLMGYRDLHAWKGGIPWPDPVAGIHAAYAVLAALWERGGRGGPTTIEVAQLETTIAMVSDRVVRAQLDGADPEILGNRHPVFAPQGVYPAAGEDRWVALCVQDDESWQALCAHIGVPDSWRSWTLASRRIAHDDIDAQIARWTGDRAAADVAALLQRDGIAAAPVVDAAEILADRHLRARSFYTEMTHPEAGTHSWMPTCVARLSATPVQLDPPAACLGQHNEEVLREWAGLSSEAIESLTAVGVVADHPPA